MAHREARTGCGRDASFDSIKASGDERRKLCLFEEGVCVIPDILSFKAFFGLGHAFVLDPRYYFLQEWILHGVGCHLAYVSCGGIRSWIRETMWVREPCAFEVHFATRVIHLFDEDVERVVCADRWSPFMELVLLFVLQLEYRKTEILSERQSCIVPRWQHQPIE